MRAQRHFLECGGPKNMRSPIRNLATAAVGFLFVFSLGGCQLSYPFRITGVVRDADGNPLPHVKVTLKAAGIINSSFPAYSGPDGTFKALVYIRDAELGRKELPKWFLQLFLEGYETATVDCSPTQKPKSTNKTTFISV